MARNELLFTLHNASRTTKFFTNQSKAPSPESPFITDLPQEALPKIPEEGREKTADLIARNVAAKNLRGPLTDVMMAFIRVNRHVRKPEEAIQGIDLDHLTELSGHTHEELEALAKHLRGMVSLAEVDGRDVFFVPDALRIRDNALAHRRRSRSKTMYADSHTS